MSTLGKLLFPWPYDNLLHRLEDVGLGCVAIVIFGLDLREEEWAYHARHREFVPPLWHTKLA